MYASLRAADANGKIIDAGRPGGFGFRLMPAADYDSADGVRPGSFPVKVTFLGGARPALTIVNSDVRYFAEKHEGFTVEGSELGAAWVVEEYFHRNEGVIPAGTKQRRTIQVQAATVVPQTNPSTSAHGYKIRPGTLSHHFYFSGAGVGTITAEIWVRTKAGVWYAGGTDAVLDPSSGPIFTRFQEAHADRIALKASGANLSVEIDADIEVG